VSSYKKVCLIIQHFKTTVVAWNFSMEIEYLSLDIGQMSRHGSQKHILKVTLNGCKNDLFGIFVFSCFISNSDQWQIGLKDAYM